MIVYLIYDFYHVLKVKFKVKIERAVGGLYLYYMYTQQIQ